MPTAIAVAGARTVLHPLGIVGLAGGQGEHPAGDLGQPNQVRRRARADRPAGQLDLEPERQVRILGGRVRLDIAGVEHRDIGGGTESTWKFIRPGVVTRVPTPPLAMTRILRPTYQNPPGRTRSACGLMTDLAVV